MTVHNRQKGFTMKQTSFDSIKEANRIIKKLQSLKAPNYKEKYYCVKVNFDTSIDDVLVHLPYPIHRIIESNEKNPKHFALISAEDKDKTDVTLQLEAKAKKKGENQ